MNNDDIREKLFKEFINGKCKNYADWEDTFYEDPTVRFYIEEAFKSGYTSRDEEVKELKQKIESLKCCGNYFYKTKTPELIKYCDYYRYYHSICDNWKGIKNESHD